MFGQILRMHDQQLADRPAAERFGIERKLLGQLVSLRGRGSEVALLDAPKVRFGHVAAAGQFGAAQVQVVAAGGEGGAQGLSMRKVVHAISIYL